MSDCLPIETQTEIMQRLPVKSLLQFRSVSKPWKSFIDSSDFIKHYSRQQKHLVNFDGKYVSVIDDDSFPTQRVSLTVPLSVNRLLDSIIIGSSHGVLCFLSSFYCEAGVILGSKIAVIWNPCIRKAVAVVVPNVAYGSRYRTVVGFGVCRETSDPKIVKITQIEDGRWRAISCISFIPLQVEIFTLSTTAWRSPRNNRPRKSIQFGSHQVVIDGVLFWLAVDRIITGDGIRLDSLIISFDMTSEVFREINLPDNLAHKSIHDLSIYKMGESLVVVDSDTKVVWMMDDGVSKSYTKLFTIIEILEDGLRTHKLVVYEPNSKHMDDVGINGTHSVTSVCPYVETLVMLDQTNLTVYDKNGNLPASVLESLRNWTMMQYIRLT